LQAVFIGNGLVAILSGLLANYLVRNLDFGPVAPFDAAMVLLAIGGVLIAATWPDNYGDETNKESTQGIVAGIHTQVCFIKESRAVRGGFGQGFART
jgi:hypothetical protein